MGTEANATVREYIVTELEKLGLEAELHSIAAPDYFGQDEPVAVINVVARVGGTANTKAIALMAHYDTVPTTPGGNDNSAAVAVLLETARALTSGPAIANDVLLIFTDGEEPAPRFGAAALIREPSMAADIGLVVNFEAIGSSGPSTLVETSGPEGWIVREFAAATRRPVAFSFITELVELIGDVGTDFDPFRNAGVPGLHLVYLRGSPIYHTAADDVDSVDSD
jgi:Zn-dependent M28 family amino/carboxypeptidase